MNSLTKFTSVGISIALVIGLAACDKPGPAETAGKKIDQTTEQAGKKIEEAADKVGKKLDK